MKAGLWKGIKSPFARFFRPGTGGFFRWGWIGRAITPLAIGLDYFLASRSDDPKVREAELAKSTVRTGATILGIVAGGLLTGGLGFLVGAGIMIGGSIISEKSRTLQTWGKNVNNWVSKKWEGAKSWFKSWF